MKKTLILSSIVVLVIIACVSIYVMYRNHTATTATSAAIDVKTTSADPAGEPGRAGTTDPAEVLRYSGDMPDYGEWTITWNELSNILHTVGNEAYRNKMISVVKNGLFQDRDQYLMTNLFMELVYGSINHPLLQEGGKYSSTYTLLCYKKLVPFLAETIIECNSTTNTEVAGRLRTMLDYIPHPDTLKAIMYIEQQLPADSPLRQGNISAWSGSFPLFMRDDCLDVYIAVMHHPGTYSYSRWYDAVQQIPKFTNDTAVAAMAEAAEINKNWRNYWPYSKKLSNYAAYNNNTIKLFRQDQQRRCEGKRPMPPAPKPLLDE